MIPYTGDYIEHIDNNTDNFKYYTFTPRPLMNGDMYKMDDELSALLIEAHRNIGFLEGLFKYTQNEEAFAELMLLKECTYSRMIDYDTPTFQDILISRGSGKSDISLITNLELAYKKAMNKTISAPFLSELCRGQTFYFTTLQLLTQFYQRWPIFLLIYIMTKILIR